MELWCLVYLDIIMLWNDLVHLCLLSWAERFPFDISTTLLGPSRYTHRICNSCWVMPRKGNFNPWKEARVKRCQCQVTFVVLTSQGGKREGTSVRSQNLRSLNRRARCGWEERGVGERYPAVVRTLTSVMTVSPPEPPEPPEPRAQCYSTSWLNLWKPRWDRHDELRQPRVEHGEENEQEHKSKRASEREKRKGGWELGGGEVKQKKIDKSEKRATKPSESSSGETCFFFCVESLLPTKPW